MHCFADYFSSIQWRFISRKLNFNKTSWNLANSKRFSFWWYRSYWVNHIRVLPLLHWILSILFSSFLPFPNPFFSICSSPSEGRGLSVAYRLAQTQMQIDRMNLTELQYTVKESKAGWRGRGALKLTNSV